MRTPGLAAGLSFGCTPLMSSPARNAVVIASTRPSARQARASLTRARVKSRSWSSFTMVVPTETIGSPSRKIVKRHCGSPSVSMMSWYTAWVTLSISVVVSCRVVGIASPLHVIRIDHEPTVQRLRNRAIARLGVSRLQPKRSPARTMGLRSSGVLGKHAPDGAELEQLTDQTARLIGIHIRGFGPPTLRVAACGLVGSHAAVRPVREVGCGAEWARATVVAFFSLSQSPIYRYFGNDRGVPAQPSDCSR